MFIFFYVSNQLLKIFSLNWTQIKLLTVCRKSFSNNMHTTKRPYYGTHFLAEHQARLGYLQTFKPSYQLFLINRPRRSLEIQLCWRDILMHLSPWKPQWIHKDTIKQPGTFLLIKTLWSWSQNAPWCSEGTEGGGNRRRREQEGESKQLLGS